MTALPIILGAGAVAVGVLLAKKGKAKAKAPGAAVTSVAPTPGVTFQPFGEPPPPLQGPSQEELDAAAQHADLVLMSAVAECPAQRAQLEAAHTDFALGVVVDANEALQTFLATVEILCATQSTGSDAETLVALALAGMPIEEIAQKIMDQYQARGQNSCNVPAVLVRRFQELAGIPVTGSIDPLTSFTMFPILGFGTVPPCNLSP